MSSTGPRVWVFKNVSDKPFEALEVEDTDQNWQDLLAEPEVFEDKGDSPAFCGCEFAPGAERRLLKHAIHTHCFIFDVDVWRPDRPPFTLDELAALFEGFRFIAYTSYSSTASQTRWRLILPLAQPLPVAKHVPLFRWINKHILDNTVADTVRDATRYGYFKTVASEEALTAYQWHVGQGEYFDWRGLELPDEDPTVVRAFQPGELQQRPEWTSLEVALEAARRKFRSAGMNLRAGENRHHQVAEHDVGHLRPHGVQRLLAVQRRHDVVARGQEHRLRFLDVGIVVDDEDARHGRAPSRRFPRPPRR